MTDFMLAAKAAPRRLAAKRSLAPEDEAAELSFGVVVRRLDALAGREAPERLPVGMDVGAQPTDDGQVDAALEKQLDGLRAVRVRRAKVARVMSPARTRCHSRGTIRVQQRSRPPGRCIAALALLAGTASIRVSIGTSRSSPPSGVGPSPSDHAPNRSLQ
jgi:hypothetical protein